MAGATMSDEQSDIVVQIRAAIKQLDQLRDINSDSNTLVAFTDTTYRGLCELLAGAADEIVLWRKQTAMMMDSIDDITGTSEKALRQAKLAAHAAQQLAIELTRTQHDLATTSEIAGTFWRHLTTPTGPADDLDAALERWKAMHDK